MPTNRHLQLGRFVFPFQIMSYSLQNYSSIYLKIIHSYTRDYLKIWKQDFSRVSSHVLKWGNKQPNLKRSINWGELNCKIIGLNINSERFSSDVSYDFSYDFGLKKGLLPKFICAIFFSSEARIFFVTKRLFLLCMVNNYNSMPTNMA